MQLLLDGLLDRLANRLVDQLAERNFITSYEPQVPGTFLHGRIPPVRPGVVPGLRYTRENAPSSISTRTGSALGELMMTYRWKSWPTRAVAGTSGPSLAGVVVTRGLKRRQGSRGVRAVSPERVKVVEAETVPVVEGHVCAIAKRDGDAPPGSRTASRTNSHHRDPRGPVGAVGIVADGDVSRGTTEARRRAETGSRIDP